MLSHSQQYNSQPYRPIPPQQFFPNPFPSLSERSLTIRREVMMIERNYRDTLDEYQGCHNTFVQECLTPLPKSVLTPLPKSVLTPLPKSV